MVELELRDMLHLDVMTVTGKTLGENLEDLEKENFFQRNLGYLHNYGLEREQVIFPVEKAREKGCQYGEFQSTWGSWLREAAMSSSLGM